MELEFFGGSFIDIELFKTILNDSLIKESTPELNRFTMQLFYNKINKDIFEKDQLSYLYSIVYEIIVAFIKLGDFYNFNFSFMLSDGIFIEDYGITFENLKEKNEYFYIIDEKQKKNIKIKKGFE